MAFDDEGNDGADGGAGRNAEDIRIRKRIAQEGLKTGAGDGKRRSDNDAEKNSRQANVHDDHAVFGGDSAGAGRRSTLRRSWPRP